MQASEDDLSERLRRIMDEKSLTQVQAAKLLGLSQSLISGYLNGKHRPLTRTLEMMTERLGLPPDWHQRPVPGTQVAPGPLPNVVYPRWLTGLKRRWKRTKERDSFILALKVLFPEDHTDVAKWLDANA